MVAIHPSQRLFVALDTPDEVRALALCVQLSGLVGGVKVGNELFTAAGPAGVARITAVGLPVFLDLKFHDIPNTVGGAVRAALALKPFMLTIHAAGGLAMMRAAVEAAAEAGTERPLLIGITVLTSMNDEALVVAGVERPVLGYAEHLAKLSRDSGLDGITCSAYEAPALRAAGGGNFVLVVPGIRSAAVRGDYKKGAVGNDDQKRTVTPAEAVRLGADYLVVGRPITGADNPAAAARAVAAEIAEALP